MEILWRISDYLLRQQGAADLFAVKGLLGHKDVNSGAEDPESLPEAGEIHPLKSFRPAGVSIWGRAWSWGMRLSETGERCRCGASRGVLRMPDKNCRPGQAAAPTEG